MLVIVFGAIFLTLFGGISGFIFLQLRQSLQKEAWAKSLQIAEAGANFYRWCLNNGIDCPLEKDFLDPIGQNIGRFSLETSGTTACGEIVSQQALSRGWTYDFPDIQREVKTLYGKVSVGKYAYLLNDNVWAGVDREIKGLYHSNGGVRMDGENQSLVTSAQESWLCTSSFGCNYWDCPTGCSREGNACRCPGVFTTSQNSNFDLFSFPVPPFDFEGITMELAVIKDLAFPYPQEKYWPPVTEIDSNAKGYHLKFFEDGTFQIWIITGLQATYAYSIEEGWHYDYFIINNEYLYDSFLLGSDCPILFFEDNLWVEGRVSEKVTVIAADLLTPGRDSDVVLVSDIEYVDLDGSDGLALVGQRNILISPNSPDIMELRGILVAQKGHFGRNHYPWNIKDTLEIYGSIVSNGRVGTQWTSGSMIVSGYLKRENYNDTNLTYFPPPFIPFVSSGFEIVNWEEVE